MKKACFESNDGCSKNYWFSISISIYWWYWSWYRYWFWVLKNIDIGLDIGFKKILILMFISILIFLSKKYWYRYWYWKRKFEKYWYWYCLKIWYCPGSACEHAHSFTHQKGLSYQIIEEEDSGLPQQGILPMSAKKQ